MEMTVEEQIRQAYEAGYSEGYADGQYDSAEETGKYNWCVDDDNDDDDFASRNYDNGWACGYEAGWKDCEIASELDFEDDGGLI
jgi:hypothetical protein